MRRKMKRIIKDNGNGFTTKELLVEHIRAQNKFESYVRDKLETGSGKIAENRTALKYMQWFLGGIGTILGVIITVLVKMVV